MLSNMASSLILNKRIETTTAKAKALRMYIEPLITKSKDDTTHSRRVVFSYLNNKYAVSELFREVSTKIADRPGGYTRILKLGNRLGDNADMCIIELVDYNENMLATSEERKSRSRRRRGSGKKKTADQVVETTQEVTEVADQKEDQPKEVTEAIEEQKAEETPQDTTDSAEPKDDESLNKQEAKSDDTGELDIDKAGSTTEVAEEVKEKVEAKEEVAKDTSKKEPEEEAAKPEAKAEEKEEKSKPEADDKKENTEKSK